MAVRILIGDCRAMLRTLEPESVHCVVTSPPYWGLRDYGTGRWEGGDAACDHRSPTMRQGRNEARATLKGSAATNSAQLLLAQKSACGKCGAVKIDEQLGLEPTVGEHIAAMVDVFNDVRRVMRKDATLWLNYGDCYATSPNGRSAADTKAAGNDNRTFRDKPFSTIGGVLKAKDLCMIPNRLAIALQENGWWVRSEIIWAKPNPMPESIKDRPATSHEKIWLLAKSERYYYDGDSVRRPLLQTSVDRLSQDVESQVGSARANGGTKTNGPMKAVASTDKQRGHRRRHAGFNERWDAMPREEQTASANLRNVWTVATAAFSDAHFATFPPELIEPCIKAGCPANGVVLDPFLGSGTTALVADRLGRNCIGIELNPEYAAMAERRIKADGPLFAKVAAQ